jgi:hypothetical protein
MGGESYDEVESLAHLIIDILNQETGPPVPRKTYAQRFHSSSELSNIRHLSFTPGVGNGPSYVSQPPFRI